MKTTNTDENRPFGFWLKAVDRLMANEFATAFESEGITRREWRLLNRIDGTVADDPRPLPAHKVARLIELGWVTDAEGTWILTDEGRSAKERLAGTVEGIRTKVTDAVPAEDLTTTLATLEKIARAFGWDEETPLPRGRGRRHGRHGFGPRGYGRHGFGRHGFGPDGLGPDGLGPDARDRDEYPASHRGEHLHGVDHGRRFPGHGWHESHGGHAGHPGGRARFARFAQGAYERGFDAGFSRGRSDQ